MSTKQKVRAAATAALRASCEQLEAKTVSLLQHIQYLADDRAKIARDYNTLVREQEALIAKHRSELQMRDQREAIAQAEYQKVCRMIPIVRSLAIAIDDVTKL